MTMSDDSGSHRAAFVPAPGRRLRSEAPRGVLPSCITAKDLCLWYGKFQALKNIRLDIKQGLITSLIGPSGCG